MKSICFIFNKAPYGNQSSRELLDICLMSCAFEMPITVIFESGGVLQLLKEQQPDILNIKDHSKTFKALELYGVETILINEQSLQHYDISENDILPIGDLVQETSISKAISDADFCMMM